MDEETKAMYEYLTILRDGGTINMWEASSYLEKKFGIDTYTAKPVLLTWMELCKQTKGTTTHDS